MPGAGCKGGDGWDGIYRGDGGVQIKISFKLINWLYPVKFEEITFVYYRKSLTEQTWNIRVQRKSSESFN